MIEEKTGTELAIPAKCSIADRSLAGFVLRLSRVDAFFATREEIPVAERARLALRLPWRLGALAVDSEVVETTWDAGSRLPGVTLLFRRLSPTHRERIERYLTHYYDLLAQLETR